MKFSYWRIAVEPSEAFPERRNIEKPLIPIRLIYNEKKVNLIALIDSGADDSIFDARLGEMAGIDGFFNLYRVEFDLNKREIELKQKRLK